MKYTVLYVEGCTPKYETFDDKEDAVKKIKELSVLEKSGGEYSDDFITGLVFGEYLEAEMGKFGEDLLGAFDE